MNFTAFVDVEADCVVARCIDVLLGWFVEVRVPRSGGVLLIDAESAPIAAAHMAESYARMMYEWSRPRERDQRDTLPAPVREDVLVLGA